LHFEVLPVSVKVVDIVVIVIIVIVSGGGLIFDGVLVLNRSAGSASLFDRAGVGVDSVGCADKEGSEEEEPK